MSNPPHASTGSAVSSRFILIDGGSAVQSWLKDIGAGGASAAEIAARAEVNRPAVWMAIKRGKLSDNLALRIAAGWGVPPLRAIAYASDTPIKDLEAPPPIGEQPALVHPLTLLHILMKRWDKDAEPIDGLAWADPRTVSAATFIHLKIDKRLDLLAEETGYSPEALRSQFWRNLPIRTALAAAKISRSSFATCLLATGVVAPEDYGLNISGISNELHRMPIDELARLAEASVKAFARMVEDSASPQEDAYL